MASNPQIDADIASKLADNDTREISEQDLREVTSDLNALKVEDSTYNEDQEVQDTGIADNAAELVAQSTRIDELVISGGGLDPAVDNTYTGEQSFNGGVKVAGVDLGTALTGGSITIKGSGSTPIPSFTAKANVEFDLPAGIYLDVDINLIIEIVYPANAGVVPGGQSVRGGLSGVVGSGIILRGGSVTQEVKVEFTGPTVVGGSGNRRDKATISNTNSVNLEDPLANLPQLLIDQVDYTSNRALYRQRLASRITGVVLLQNSAGDIQPGTVITAELDLVAQGTAGDYPNGTTFFVRGGHARWRYADNYLLETAQATAET